MKKLVFLFLIFIIGCTQSTIDNIGSTSNSIAPEIEEDNHKPTYTIHYFIDETGNRNTAGIISKIIINRAIIELNDRYGNQFKANFIDTKSDKKYTGNLLKQSHTNYRIGKFSSALKYVISDPLGSDTISIFSTSPSLTKIDNFYRIFPSDENVLNALILSLKQENISSIALLLTDDDWGRSLQTHIGNNYDGEIYPIIINSEYESVTIQLSEIATKKNIQAIFSNEYDALSNFFIEASKYENLHIPWFAMEDILLDNMFFEIASNPEYQDFIKNTQLTIPKLQLKDLKKIEEIKKIITKELNPEEDLIISNKYYGFYDATILVGEALIRNISITKIELEGITHNIVLNEYGDSSEFKYDMMQLQKDGWQKIGEYDSINKKLK